MMEEPLAAVMIWKLRLRNIWPKKEASEMTVSNAASDLPTSTALSGYPTCSQQRCTPYQGSCWSFVPGGFKNTKEADSSPELNCRVEQLPRGTRNSSSALKARTYTAKN